MKYFVIIIFAFLLFAFNIKQSREYITIEHMGQTDKPYPKLIISKAFIPCSLFCTNIILSKNDYLHLRIFLTNSKI